MEFTSDPFELYTTNVRDKTFKNTLESYTQKLSWKLLYLNQWNTFKSRFMTKEPHCVKSYISTKLNIKESK